jgi:hypothetical protein
MKSQKANHQRETHEGRVINVDGLALPDLGSSLREQFEGVATDIEAANRRNLLAILKILELIVSRRIRQRPGENYFVTICRLIVHGPPDTHTSAPTRRTLNKALAEIKRGNPWTTSVADIAEMRSWRGKRAVTRTILLLTILENSIGRDALTGWLQRSNPNLGDQAPVDLMRADRWVVLADFVDDMLTGSTT